MAIDLWANFVLLRGQFTNNIPGQEETRERVQSPHHIRYTEFSDHKERKVNHALSELSSRLLF